MTNFFPGRRRFNGLVFEDDFWIRERRVACLDSRFNFLVGALWGSLEVREEGRDDLIGRDLEGGRGAWEVSMGDRVNDGGKLYHFEY